MLWLYNIISNLLILKFLIFVIEIVPKLPWQGRQIASQFWDIHVPSHGVTPGLEQSTDKQLAPLPFPPGQQDTQSLVHPSLVLDVKHWSVQGQTNYIKNAGNYKYLIITSE